MITKRRIDKDEYPVIALTGATGFIGNYMLASLLEDKYRVTILIRDTAKLAARFFDHEALDIVIGDITDEGSISELCQNATGIIHCAGLIRAARNAEFFETNTTATRRLIATAEKSNVNWFVLISSLAAREPGISSYAASKSQAEAALHSAGGNLDWAIIRPPCVYGPGDDETSRLIRGARMGMLPTVADRTARFSLLHAADLVAAITDLVRGGRFENEVIEPDDGKPGGYSWAEIAAVLSSVLMQPVRSMHLPYLPVLAIVSVYSALSSAAGIAPVLSPAKLRELSHADWVSKTHREHPTFKRYWGRDLRAAITDMIVWMEDSAGQDGGRRQHV